LDDVLPNVRQFVPESQFAILGKAGSPQLMECINKSNGVRYSPHVKEMNDFYQTISVLLVRNYKCLGLINRTVEAMAAGVVVIGERGAFNGIVGFQDGMHGFIAENTRETVDCLVNILSNKAIKKSVSHAARNLIQSKFQWKDRIVLANLLIKDGMSEIFSSK
jgi:glycosyltransferase involved in cell wall biosynthesis